MFGLVLTSIGVLLLLLVFFVDLPMKGMYGATIPFSIITWGITAFWLDLSSSFLVGFLPVFMIMEIAYVFRRSSTLTDLIFNSATVVHELKFEAKGEIALENGTHLAARSYDKSRISEGTTVRIINFEKDIAIVSLQLLILPEQKLPVNYKRLVEKWLNRFSPKSRVYGTCMVCQKLLIASKHGYTCIHCKNVAHWSHMKLWLSEKTHCPNCNGNLSSVSALLKKNGDKKVQSVPTIKSN